MLPIPWNQDMKSPFRMVQKGGHSQEKVLHELANCGRVTNIHQQSPSQSVYRSVRLSSQWLYSKDKNWLIVLTRVPMLSCFIPHLPAQGHNTPYSYKHSQTRQLTVNRLCSYTYTDSAFSDYKGAHTQKLSYWLFWKHTPLHLFTYLDTKKSNNCTPPIPLIAKWNCKKRCYTCNSPVKHLREDLRQSQCTAASRLFGVNL